MNKTSSGLSEKNIKLCNRGRTPTGEPNPIDVHVGNRIRIRRLLLGISQEVLAKFLGLTFQQVQKYERGQNRAGSSRLWDLAQVLEVSVGFFFEEITPEIAGQSPRCFVLPESTIEPAKLPETDPMSRAETYELIRDYYRIRNRKLAESLRSIIHETAKSYIPNSESEE